VKRHDFILLALLVGVLLALRFREQVTSKIYYPPPGHASQPPAAGEPQPPPWAGKPGEVVVWNGQQWGWVELLSTGWAGWTPIARPGG